MEQWKDIFEFEGLYQVSNFGRVKSFIKYHGTNERILKPSKDRGGYLLVCLSKNGKHYMRYVHRLVAEAFIPNDDLFKTDINHKNEMKIDNNFENLEWVTCAENINHGTRNERMAKTNTNGKLSKEVLQLSLDGTLVSEWPSTHEIQRELGFGQSHISACCIGKLKTAYGFIWKYKNDEQN